MSQAFLFKTICFGNLPFCKYMSQSRFSSNQKVILLTTNRDYVLMICYYLPVSSTSKNNWATCWSYLSCIWKNIHYPDCLEFKTSIYHLLNTYCIICVPKTFNHFKLHCLPYLMVFISLVHYINEKLRLAIVLSGSTWIQIPWHTEKEEKARKICLLRFLSFNSVRIWATFQCVNRSGWIVKEFLISLCLFIFWGKKFL